MNEAGQEKIGFSLSLSLYQRATKFLVHHHYTTDYCKVTLVRTRGQERWAKRVGGSNLIVGLDDSIAFWESAREWIYSLLEREGVGGGR